MQHIVAVISILSLYPVDITAQRTYTQALGNLDGQRIVIIGDVHGCYNEMMTSLSDNKMLDAPEGRVSNGNTLIFVGDLVNKGPASERVIKWLRRDAGPNAFSVVGNHELNALEKGCIHYGWTCSENDRTFMARLPYSVTFELCERDRDLPRECQLYRVLHAGVNPGKTRFEDNTEEELTRIRRAVDNGDGTYESIEDSQGPGRLWSVYYSSGMHGAIVFGHNSRDGFQKHQWTRGLDTGCYKGGHLRSFRIDRFHRNGFVDESTKPVYRDIPCEGRGHDEQEGWQDEDD